MTYQLRPYQITAVEAAVLWMKKTIEPCVLDLAPGCHEAGHPILMYDGTIKPAEAVSVGDKVMGPDSTPRRVQELHRGVDKMYRVTPTKGEPFTVNAGHIFSLYVTPRRAGDSPGYSECTADQLYGETKHFRRLRKLQRCAVDLPHHTLPVPPWVVGVMIGDGSMTTGTPSLCSPDKEVIDNLDEWVKSIGCVMNRKWGGDRKRAWDCNITDPRSSKIAKNGALKRLEQAGVYWSKSKDARIPQEYKAASRAQRLDLIAGLVDSDGSLSRGGYDWISASKKLADDLVFLCRSVGLAAYVKECIKKCQNNFSGTYYRVSISGDCSVVPCRLSRKKAPKRKQIKRVDVTGFSIEPSGWGSYYGFSLDGDRLYLDGHFVRHHNSGKSLIIANVAKWLHDNTGKRVLCLAPSKELTEQNHSKYIAYGNDASIFSASIGKSLRYPVVFGTPQSVKNSLSRFTNGDYSLVIVDECHGTTKTIKAIIAELKKANPNLRVVGLSATPYRMNTGYIYRYEPDGSPVPDDEAIDPYFNTCIYRIGANELIAMGFLTPAHADPDHVGGYDTSALKLNSRGRFDADAVDKAFVGHGRKTSGIIADVIDHAKDRLGVMIFAATIAHAHEVMASLPPELSALITGDTPTDKRDSIIARFKRMEIKYLVNVAVLTTGFDVPHVDVVAILRKTESASLFQQIIGRGLRLSPDTGKVDCLVLDYAENVEFHQLQDDLFAPQIKTRRSGESEPINVICPACNTINAFKMRPNPDDYKISEDGYFLDLAGEPIEVKEGVYLPAHYGRRCFGQSIVAGGVFERCEYRWEFKACPECEHENDIAARFCEECKAELVDPNERLREEFQRIKADPYTTSTDHVRTFRAQKWIGKSGNETLRCDYTTDYASFSIWYTPKIKPQWNDLCIACYGKVAPDIDTFVEHLDKSRIPLTITAYKDKNSKFYRAVAHNRPVDEIPD